MGENQPLLHKTNVMSESSGRRGETQHLPSRCATPHSNESRLHEARANSAKRAENEGLGPGEREAERGDTGRGWDDED